MKESHREEVAHHTDPESCASRRKVAGEALTGAHADPALSCQIKSSGTPTPLRQAESHMGRGDTREPRFNPTQSETLAGNPQPAASGKPCMLHIISSPPSWVPPAGALAFQRLCCFPTQVRHPFRG